jgi:hypothetical protein
VKLLLLLVVAGLALYGRRQSGLNKPLYVSIGVLSIANAAVAWLW